MSRQVVMLPPYAAGPGTKLQFLTDLSEGEKICDEISQPGYSYAYRGATGDASCDTDGGDESSFYPQHLHLTRSAFLNARAFRVEHAINLAEA